MADKPVAWLHGEVKILPAAVFSKKTRATPKSVLDTCRRRLRASDAAVAGGD